MCATNTISESPLVHYSLTCSDAAGVQKAIEQNGLELQTIHLEVACRLLLSYFKSNPFRGCFSEMNLFAAEFTVVSVYYSPASACLCCLNQRLCRSKTSTKSKPPWQGKNSPLKLRRCSFQIHTSPATACDVSSSPTCLDSPGPLTLRLYQALAHLRFSHMLLFSPAFSHHTISILLFASPTLVHLLNVNSNMTFLIPQTSSRSPFPFS